MKYLLKLILFIGVSTYAGNFDYIYQAANVFECFGDVDFKEYSPGRRNTGFDKCIEGFDGLFNPYQCASLADRYYGLSAKNKAMNVCFDKASNFEMCLSIADDMPSMPARMEGASKCLNKFINQITKVECLNVGWMYKPLERHINAMCEEHFGK